MKLGKTQISVLESIKEHKHFVVGGGWTWGTYLQTEKICDSLVKKGMLDVERVTNYARPLGTNKYTLSEKGLAYLKQNV